MSMIEPPETMAEPWDTGGPAALTMAAQPTDHAGSVAI